MLEAGTLRQVVDWCYWMAIWAMIICTINIIYFAVKEWQDPETKQFPLFRKLFLVVKFVALFIANLLKLLISLIFYLVFAVAFAGALAFGITALIPILPFWPWFILFLVIGVIAAFSIAFD